MTGIYLVKVGGTVISDEKAVSGMLDEIAGLSREGYKIVVVHGGGNEISAEMKRRGIQPTMVNGQRMTDAETLDCVESVLENINRKIVSMLNKKGVDAVGVPAYSFTMSRRRPPFEIERDGKAEKIDMGYLGEVESVDPSPILEMTGNGRVPVVFPVGSDGKTHLNVNADVMAAGVAAGIRCREMIAVTDVPGVLTDIHDPSSKLDALTFDDIAALIKDGTISGGMIPKVESCQAAVAAGAGSTRMIDGRSPGALTAAFRGEPVGTLITAGNPADVERFA